jgi:ABC-type glycerol-3-phosphate transport system permease component
MESNTILILSILLAVLGLIVVGGVVWFGFVITRSPRKDRELMGHPMWEELFHYWAKRGSGYYDEIPRLAHDSYTEYLQRRNEFWTAYGQVLLAVLIVIVLAILLITKTISAEAGLPILSGISGFAIAKGVSAAKSNTTPQPRRPNEG